MDFKKLLRRNKKRSWLFSYCVVFNHTQIVGNIEIRTSRKVNGEAIGDIRTIIKNRLIERGLITEAYEGPTITFFKEIDN